MRIGIVGYGVVGKAVAALFSKNPGHQVFLYDKFQPALNSDQHRHAINACDLTFVAVPTPTGPDGMSCDVSAVEECASWIGVPTCIKSTIPPGTCDRLAKTFGRGIVFSPEYVGESHWHPWKNIDAHGFVIVGGDEGVRRLVLAAYQSCLGPDVVYWQTDARTAEVCKYMENCFLATKVAFVNQFYDIADALDVNFDELRELWLADARIGRSHTIVTEERGFRGRCLPKDIKAIITVMQNHGGAPFLEAVLRYNAALCAEADKGKQTLRPTPVHNGNGHRVASERE